MSKVFIDVLVKFSKSGIKTPICIIWVNGRKYSVDKVLDVAQAASLKAGGRGIRYKCLIHGRETFLWFEDGKWFVDQK